MAETKTVVRFFTIADFEEEEAWLREQHNCGWKLTNASFFLFTFERCEPEDVVYRLDYKNGETDEDYFQLFRDYGWEYFNQFAGWLYFRKPVAEVETEADGEIFSDSLSRVEMVQHVVKTRMLPLLVLFLCCVLPNLIRSIYGDFPSSRLFSVLFGIMFVLYCYLITYCGIKLARLRRKYTEQ